MPLDGLFIGNEFWRNKMTAWRDIERVQWTSQKKKEMKSEAMLVFVWNWYRNKELHRNLRTSSMIQRAFIGKFSKYRNLPKSPLKSYCTRKPLTSSNNSTRVHPLMKITVAATQYSTLSPNHEIPSRIYIWTSKAKQHDEHDMESMP